ncbi:hypothetical protein NHX12_020713, partial [Muraenolepis orangiensis]
YFEVIRLIEVCGFHRYFLHGLCKEGLNCRYAHHHLSSSTPAAMICKFFQKGNCVFGDRCRQEKSAKPPPVYTDPHSYNGSLELGPDRKGSGVLGPGFEHSKALKQDDVQGSPVPPLPSAPLPPSTTGAPGDPDPPEEAGGWVNAAEFVPGQPYCGRAAPMSTLYWRRIPQETVQD